MHFNFKKMIFFLIILFFTFSYVSAKQIKGKEYLKSLVLPGLGEVTSGYKSGYVLIASEILVWSSRWYILNEQKLKDKQSYLQAIQFAHINKDVNISDSYAEKLKKYMSSGFETGGYNQEVLQKAIALYPDDKEKQDEYIKENMIPDDLSWEWDSKAHKHDFGIMRKRILQYSNYLKINTGLFLVNRLISFINLTALKKKLEITSYLNSNYDTVISLNYKF